MNIEELIKKFYEGVTTSEEERLLMEYFLNEADVDERWKEEQQLFRLLHDSQIEVPESISKRLEASILQMDAPPKSVPFRRKLYYWISSSAAVVLLCIGLFFAIRQPAHLRRSDTFSDPKEAALVAQQTLIYMSTQLNKGLDKVADADQKLEKVNQLLNKHLNKKL